MLKPSQRAREAAEEIVSAANIVTCDGYYEIDIDKVELLVHRFEAETLERAGWRDIADLDHDDYVLGWVNRSDGYLPRSYFIGCRYDLRRNALLNEHSGRWIEVTQWMPLPPAPETPNER